VSRSTTHLRSRNRLTSEIGGGAAAPHTLNIGSFAPLADIARDGPIGHCARLPLQGTRILRVEADCTACVFVRPYAAMRESRRRHPVMARYALAVGFGLFLEALLLLQGLPCSRRSDGLVTGSPVC
jgi:hypothetical protein